MTRDKLTGLLTRQEFLRLLGEPQAGTLLYIDIDRMKSANDALGHPEGDEIISRTAAIVSTIFPNNMVARFGGDEFMVFTEDADNVASLAEAVRSTVAGQFEVERNRIGTQCAEAGRAAPAPLLTVSIGIVEVGRHANLNRALQAVDEANQRAQVAGRNCVAY